MMVPWFLVMPIIMNPDSTLSMVLSLIPIYTPMTMFIRILVSEPPLWQVGLSIAPRGRRRSSASSGSRRRSSASASSPRQAPDDSRALALAEGGLRKRIDSKPGPRSERRPGAESYSFRGML